ncbi:Zn-dependent amino-or carboxypeptidase, M28 family [Bryocella elongata]|uniref:Zn-dependent amino-or carboxypeptidase, M28 family n=1 Tax=Bryocella elongata TaxID=863522 RepID=A0A1H6BFS0_9BACT|nr:M28 family peptidase [Bryocella elongata]SEG59492.1 Zn-dependent amino-or carboxypeptidase, M28 family [Bryocella elongata]
MRTLSGVLCGVLLAAASSSYAQEHPRDGAIHDVDTKAWWHTTEALSNDGMEGRDTGSEAYLRAAAYVVKRFEAAGLKPAGESGGYLQNVPLHQVEIDAKTAWIVVNEGEKSSNTFRLRFLEDITAAVNEATPVDTTGDLVFRGYCGKDALGADVAGKVVVCFGTKREGLPSGAERARNVQGAGGVAIVNVDDPYFSIEPPRWPFAYARSVTIHEAGTAPREGRGGKPFVSFTLSAEAFTKMLAGSGQDAAAILKAGGAKQPLPSFDLTGRSLSAHLEKHAKEISSPNVIGLLEGSDPALKDEVLVIAAHLDGYGYGEPVKGDNLYNGTLDDAAYVALVIQYADDVKAGRLPKPKRSVLVCAFTGEEKGLLGSNYFVAHPTIDFSKIVADINLDQLRPLFPLHILTAPGVDITTLGATARAVGKPMGIEIRDDMEPERGLLRRADNFPFLNKGVPAIGFIFGYDAGTDAEKRYREWYQVRYHRPQDDLTQPMDFDAATKFDTFFYKLVGTVADGARPEMVKK